MFLAYYLSLMLKTGVSITKGINLLAEQSKNKMLKKILLEILNDINSGTNISDAMAKYPHVFDDLFVNMVKAGESAGNLEEVLETIAEELKKTSEFRSKIKGAITYPIIIVSIMILVTVFIVFFVFPKILKVYESLKVKTPTTTKILISVIHFTTNNITYILGGLFFIILFIFIWAKTKSGKRFFDWLWLKLPIIKDLTQKINTVQFIRTFSSLLNSGIPTPKALEITSKTISSTYYSESLIIMSSKIIEGKQLSEAIRQFKNLYPPIIEQVISVGEETGQISNIFKQLSGFLEKEIDNFLNNFSKLVEPVLMIVLGVIVGFIALATIQLIYASVQTISS